MNNHKITVTPGNHVELNYKTDNAAFEGLENPVDGLQIDRVQSMIDKDAFAGPLYDMNGNQVGTWKMIASEVPSAPKTLQCNLGSSLDCTEEALDYVRGIAKYYQSPTLKVIEKLLAITFDLLDDEQQVMGDQIEAMKKKMEPHKNIA